MTEHNVLWRGDFLDGVLTITDCSEDQNHVHFYLESLDQEFHGTLTLISTKSIAHNIDNIIKAIEAAYMSKLMTNAKEGIADGNHRLQ